MNQPKATTMSNETNKSGDPTASSAADLSKAAPQIKETTFEDTKLSTAPLNWNEVWYTNCVLISAANVDQDLGWTREEFKKIGVKFAYLRSVRENDWYSHYIHNQDNLIRFGGLFPPIAVHADLRRTRLLGLTHAPHEGGCMLVCARDDIYRGIEHIDMVPNLSPQNLASVEIGKDFMLSHDYIKNDFDVQQWAAPEFLEQAAEELVNERWAKVTGDKLPAASTARLG